MVDNTYKKVYIFIETGYKWGKGHTTEQSATFEAEIRKILTELGFNVWTRSFSASALECYNDSENLYCHPMDLVGVLKPESIPAIEKALKESKVIKFSHTKVYDLTDDDIARYETKRAELSLTEK